MEPDLAARRIPETTERHLSEVHGIEPWAERTGLQHQRLHFQGGCDHEHFTRSGPSATTS